jgi:hypothetical protein
MQLDWLEILGKVFDVAIIPILGALAAYLVTLIKAQKEEILEKTKNETIKKYVEMLEKTVTDCVLATNQTYVKTLKEQGTFDENAQKEAFLATYDMVMSLLTADAKEYLSEVINDLDAYVTNRIESQINILK